MYKHCFLPCFCASQRVQRQKAELTLAQIWKNYQTAGPIGTKFGTHVQIHMGMDIRQTNCPSRGDTWGFGGQQFKSIGSRLRIHLGMDIGYTSLPSIPQGALGWGGGVSQIQKYWEAVNRLDRLAPNLAHMFKFIWDWIYAKQIALRDTWGFRGSNIQKS